MIVFDDPQYEIMLQEAQDSINDSQTQIDYHVRNAQTHRNALYSLIQGKSYPLDVIEGAQEDLEEANQFLQTRTMLRGFNQNNSLPYT